MTAAKGPPKLVVGVGASAGGLEAFKQFLSALPADTGMAFLLVQHLDPTHKSLLSELLTPCTAMTVREADQGLSIQPDSVYIIQPDTALAVKGGRIELTTPTLHRGVRLPVDHLFRSLAKDCGPQSVGIVLSGAGSDGSAGLRDIKASGGLTVAQDPDTSGQAGMPQSAIDTGVVDLVLRIRDMPAALERFSDLPSSTRFEPRDAPAEELSETLTSLDEEALQRLTAVLEAHMNFDLRVYKSGTVERRVLRRMALSGFEEPDSYFEQLRMEPAEQQKLIRDLLISVTEFFRDPESFKALRELVIDPMVAKAPAGSTLRAWVPACATGEEAYSLGIEFLDAIDDHGKRLQLQIFATDIDQEALAFARTAIYPTSVAEHLTQSRLTSYFKLLEGKGFQVRSPLRDIVSFAAHDLTKDPPFSRMGLVSCRNVLIYLTPDAQKHVLKVLHFALEPEGHLFLSTSESTGPQRDLFATVSKSQRIYRKVGASQAISVARSRSRLVPDLEEAADDDGPATGRRTPSGGDLARRAVLQAMVPPTIVVSQGGQIVFSHGELAPHLRIPLGDNPQLDLGSMLRPEIATRARGALYKCRRNKETVAALSSPDSSSGRVRIVARPAPSLGDDTVILTFEDVSADTLSLAVERSEVPGDEAVIEELEKELQATREDLRNTVEELETSNEELRSSNEESMSMNEELQSANEELEATTEELRSLNEELTTVNAQLREKVDQVELAHDDLHNFFSSTKVATIFLDDRLCIKRFTPEAQELLGIDHTDTGRYIGDIARDLLQNDLDREAKTVLDHLSTKSRELSSSDGRWITRKILPYRTENRRIEGVVVTFTDITELREANEELNRKNRRLELAWEAARGGILEHRVPLDETTYVSDQWAQVLGYRLDELPSYDRLLPWLYEQAHPEDREKLEAAYSDLLEGRSDRYALELRFRHHGGHWIWVRKIAKALGRTSDGHVPQVLRMMIDITDLKEAEASLKESEARFREMADGLPLMVWVHDETGNQELVNETYCEFFGVTREEMKGGRWQMLVHPEDADAYTRKFHACVQDQRPFHAEARVKHADGTWRWVESWGQPRISSLGEFRGFVGTSADVTDRRQMEHDLRESEERCRMLADNISQLAWTCEELGTATWYNRRWYEYTGTTWKEMQGDGWAKVVHPAHLERVCHGIEGPREAEAPWEDTFPLRGTDGTYRWFLSRAVPIRDESGEVVKWFGTNTDVTELREYEQRLLQADRQKDEFLAMLGHELRNPLAAIRTATEVLKVHTEGDRRLGRTQQILERQTTHMAKLLDGLLDVSRIIRGKIKIEPEVVDFGTICREGATDVIESLGRRKVEVEIDVPEDPLRVEGDRVRLTQIVSNLLSNAVKFTPDGGKVDLSVHRNDGMAVLSVRDTGVGIKPVLLPHVFEIFRQSNQSDDRSQGGLGLGLSLVKTLVDLHGGSVEARSEGEGKGSEFLVRIPVSRNAPPEPVAEDRSNGSPLRILVIEDNEDAAEMLKQVLELCGHRVTTAHRGREGLAAARKGPPDAILCDLGLPGGMSGFDVARELRSDENLREVPLIALSGYGRPEDKAQTAEVGFDAHLTKPVDVKALERILAEMAAKNPGDSTEA